MNAYYNNSRHYNSNNDIFTAYFYGESVRVPAWKRFVDSLLSYLGILLAALSGTVAKRLYKAASVALCLVGVIGLIGAMESGAISLGLGVLIALPLLAIEFFTLRKH